MNLRRIVAATDFSEASKLAIQTAFRLGSESEALIYLLHVLELPTGIDPLVGLLKPPMTEARKKATQQLRQLRSANRYRDLEVQEKVLVGPIAKSIADFAREKKADMIVVGTHGRRGMARVLLGSTAEELLRHAECQVLTVKQPGEAPVADPSE